MKELKILQNKDGKIVVDVKVKKRKFMSDPYVQVGYGEVIEFLKTEGITQNLKLVEGQIVGNHAENIPRTGKFVLTDSGFSNDHYDLSDLNNSNKEEEQKINLTSSTDSDTVSKVETVEQEEEVEVIVPQPKTPRRRRRSRGARAKETDKLLGTEAVE